MKRILIFMAGAAIGSLVTWKLIEEKYKKIADEEIESVIEQYKNRQKDEIRTSGYCNVGNKEVIEEVETTTTQYPEVESIRTTEEYKEQLENLGYNTVIDMAKKIEKIKPYIISPEEFGEFGNDTKSLTYYSDLVLTDDEGDIVVDPESIIGDALEHFGEYEDDAVHVRDENIECDYEILRSEKKFGDIYKEDN